MLQIHNPGPQLEEGDVREVEVRLGAPLAPEYRAFLLGSNGGIPSPDCVTISKYGETDVQVIFGIGRAVRTSCISWNLDALKDRLLSGLLPIACDSGGNVFCLSYSGSSCGEIVYLDLESVYGEYDVKAPLYLVAPSFNDFLSSLKP